MRAGECLRAIKERFRSQPCWNMMADLQRKVAFFRVSLTLVNYAVIKVVPPVLVALKLEEGSGYPLQGSLFCLKGSLKFLAPRLEDF